MQKRFILFAGDHYYPEGGWDDFQGFFDTAEEAFAKAKEKIIFEDNSGSYSFDWYNVVDALTWEVVIEDTDETKLVDI